MKRLGENNNHSHSPFSTFKRKLAHGQTKENGKKVAIYALEKELDRRRKQNSSNSIDILKPFVFIGTQ